MERLRRANAEELQRLAAEREKEAALLTEERRRETDRLEDETIGCAARWRRSTRNSRASATKRQRVYARAGRRRRASATPVKARLLTGDAEARTARPALTARAEKLQFEAELDEEKRAALLERDLERARLREAQAEETARLMDERDAERAHAVRGGVGADGGERAGTKAADGRARRGDGAAGGGARRRKARLASLLAERAAETARLREERDAEKARLLEEREAALRETREKGLEEVARLREANEKLSESAEAARRAADARGAPSWRRARRRWLPPRRASAR